MTITVTQKRTWKSIWNSTMHLHLHLRLHLRLCVGGARTLNRTGFLIHSLFILYSLLFSFSNKIKKIKIETFKTSDIALWNLLSGTCTDNRLYDCLFVFAHRDS